MNQTEIVARIHRLQSELEALIAAHVENERRKCPGVPAEMHRQLLTKGSGCLCAIAQRLLKEKERQNALAD
jgi:hypothetical protein